MSSNEILTIRLGARENQGDPGDPTGSWVAGMTEQDAWEAGSKWWVFKAGRAIECSTVLILSPDCKVIAEAEILGLRKDTVDRKRLEILGELKTNDYEFLGQTIPRGTSQNPVAYIKRDALK